MMMMIGIKEEERINLAIALHAWDDAAMWWDFYICPPYWFKSNGEM